jgi:hypothetical protein
VKITLVAAGQFRRGMAQDRAGIGSDDRASDAAGVGA